MQTVNKERFLEVLKNHTGEYLYVLNIEQSISEDSTTITLKYFGKDENE